MVIAQYAVQYPNTQFWGCSSFVLPDAAIANKPNYVEDQK